MKLSKLALIAAVACGINASNLMDVRANEINLVSCFESSCDCGEPVCGCEPVCCEPTCDDNACCEPECGCEVACGGDTCCDSGCDSAAGCGILGGLGDCGDCGADPCSLFGDVGHGITVGGWAQLGYHTAALPLFNSRPDELQLHQGWLYAEKAIDTSCGFDIGGRIDYVYGTDGPDTQAFGIDNDHWDNGWDNGGDYGHALPQAYVEMGYGDLSVKMGHFFTIIGWEVVGAPDNFFYSHAYTMYNSEPFTHTGALATYNVSDDISVWGGYTTGWDSGFEDNGDSFLGGASLGLTDDITMIYATTFGRFNERQGSAEGAESGYMHSLIFDVAVSDNLQYVFQSDVLDSEYADGTTARSTFGINQYLMYTLNDCTAVGARFEWYDANEGIYNSDNDIYALTTGINYKPHSNVMLRPELRWDWVDGDSTGILENDDDNQFSFGMDSIFLF
ncbi:Putative beta-barrel porin-2, OmpL-like. bbp2 [Neorhodopirellula lusitana]|uniref:Beta-barrel porin-2, OmpL-like. bbp2 n=1 Tax=Neorhodopirellula lusitana TaxID=445327 RepID=A0ABY1PYJ8_9BACT|nr:outer membrane beta-barrel protein [Neorhodopirellula lusitana]SMP51404.1 Putative beta-barrel porin-2, OmpL-like. bbp2 [Neorhodopirellula lusitana]